MKHFTLLAVDDSRDNLFLIEQLVTTYLPDCRVVTAASARAGLELAACRSFDGALIDVQMPEVNGIEMCRLLHSRDGTRRLPVLMITAEDSTPQLRAEALEAGADDFICRPIDNVELIARLRVMFRSRRAETALAEARNEMEARVRERTTELNSANARLKEEIAERKRTAGALQQALEQSRCRAAETAALLKGVRAVLEEVRFPDAARSIFNSCRRLLGATAGYVALTSADGTQNELVYLEAGGQDCSVDPNAPMPLRGLRAEACRTGRSVYENDFANSCWVDLLPDGHTFLENVLFAPLLIEGRVVGLLGLANKPGGFTDEDARMASAFAEFASIALGRSKTLASLEASRKELAVRNRIAQAFLTLGGGEVFQEALTIVLEALESRHGVFGYIDEAGNLVCPSMTGEVFQQCRMADKATVFPRQSWGNSIWGRAISEGRVLFSNRPFTVPPGHIAMARGVFSPIVYQDGVIGLINVANKQTDYDQSDLELLQTICIHIAPVLHARIQRDRHEHQREQAEEALRRAHHELENRVQARTADLLAANEHLQVEIFERRRAEHALQETNALLERVFSTTQVLLAYLDTSFRFIRVNRAYAEHDRRNPEFFAGKNHFELYPSAENRAIFQSVIQTGEPVSFHGRPFAYSSRHEGSLSYWDWSLHPVKNESGAVEGLLLCLLDVTKRELAEAQARRHQAELAHVSRLNTMGEMGSAIAHELNQPLCAILASAQASLRLLKVAQMPDSPVFEAIEQVAVQARRAGDIVRHLREFTRRRAFHRSSIHIAEVVRQAAGFVAAEARPHRVRIKLHLPECLPVILGDSIQIEQVLVNLMRNGIEAMEGVDENSRELDIAVSIPEPDVVEVAIRDTGRGLPEAERERVFEPFFSSKPEGLGIGLSISRSIIEGHGGRLWAVPAAGRGSVFRFVLPAGEAEERAV